MYCKDEKSLHQPKCIEHILCARPSWVLGKHRCAGVKARGLLGEIEVRT